MFLQLRQWHVRAVLMDGCSCSPSSLSHSITASCLIVGRCEILIYCGTNIISNVVDSAILALSAAMKGKVRFHTSLWKNCRMFKWRAWRKKRSWHPATLHKTPGLLCVCVVMETIPSLATFFLSYNQLFSSGEMTGTSQVKDRDNKNRLGPVRPARSTALRSRGHVTSALQPLALNTSRFIWFIWPPLPSI